MTGPERGVLVVEHEAAAGIGNFGYWLADAGLSVEVCRPYAGEVLPDGSAGRGLIVLGGPMGARDDHLAPWLPATRALLRNAVTDRTPVLGVCLGAQLLAVASGGTIETGAAGPEVGVTHVVTDHRQDRLLRGIAAPAPFVQWHFDAITRLPAAAAVLAHSASNRYEAFRVGEKAWGVSFHPEVEFDDLQRWARLTSEQLAEFGIEPDRVVDDVRVRREAIMDASRAIADNFAAIVKSPESGL